MTTDRAAAITLENWLRSKLDGLESMREFDVATDTVRAWIDLYNDLHAQPDWIPVAERLPSDKTK